MLTPTNISFDDGLVEGLKWGRTAAAYGLQCTFYVCPGLLGRPFLNRPNRFCMTERHVEMLAGMGHLIGNHTMRHEAPCSHSWIVVVDSIEDAGEWLDDRGYLGQLLALTYGSVGGHWTPDQVRSLHQTGYTVRDFFPENERCDPLMSPTEQRTFHGNYSTRDQDIAWFFANVAEGLAARAPSLEVAGSSALSLTSVVKENK
jgi:hypothetical protein